MKDMTAAFGLPEPGAASRPGASMRICESDFPIADIPPEGDFALAVITGIEGAAYRPLGAAMIIDAKGEISGSLSSGCLERDVILQAQAAMKAGQPRALRYGRGSPFLDIQLPCGGGLDICILPNPDRALIARAIHALRQRQTARIGLHRDGRLSEAAPGADDAVLTLEILPQIRFVVLGAGPEAACFAALARQAGYPTELHSPDAQTLARAGFGEPITAMGWPGGLALDPRTAVTLFFHDHGHEPALLQTALAGPAFYVGAQGSLRAHRSRCEALRENGVSEADIARLASPFGLIPSARDARTLAVSVLADVLQRAQSSAQSGTQSGARPA
ncbi:XdhC family protein [Paracoccus sp. (in: a-proteobacteria)]|uniref:XdhC family protein n=1 Tax=Paracoccus sp. TaxID=267 RepID=UPI0035B17C65